MPGSSSQSSRLTRASIDGAPPGLIVRLPNDAIEYLLDYADANFSRSSEAAAVDPRNGWAFYDLATPWPGADVARILSDEAILVEGSRTNLHEQSEDLSSGASGGWSDVNTPTRDGSQAAPDGGGDGWRITDDAASGEGIQDGSAVSASTQYVTSLFVLKDEDETRYPMVQITDGTSTLRGFINTATGAVQDGSTVGTFDDIYSVDEGSWWRFVLVWTTAAGATTATHRLYPAGATVMGTFSGAAVGSATMWGIVTAQAAFPSSPVRASGAAATRAADVATFATTPARMLSGRWKHKFWALADSGQIRHQLWRFNATSTSDQIWLDTGGELRIRIAGTIRTVATLTWSAFQELSLTFDPGSNEVVVEGATTGNGTYNPHGSSWTWPAGQLSVGTDNTNFAWGILSRPEAA